MEFVKRSWQQIKVQTAGLTRAERSLIYCCLFIGVCAVFILVWVACSPEMVPISSFAAGRSDQVMAQLSAAGIDAVAKDGQLLVPQKQFNEAMHILVRDGLLSANTSEAFDKLIMNQSPWLTARQGDRNFLIAKQDELESILRGFEGVRSASVFLGEPTLIGFGGSLKDPSASVSIRMEGGKSVKPLVEGIAALVSGAVAEMKTQHVDIIDTGNGKSYNVKSPDDIDTTEMMDIVRQRENYYREKIEDALGYISGIVVAVNVMTTNIHSRSLQEQAYEENQLIITDESMERTIINRPDSGEPGARPNTGMNITGGGGGGSEETLFETKTTSGDKPLVQTAITKIGPYQITQINASVSVPRSYFVQLLKRDNPDQEDAPSDADLDSIRIAELDNIKKKITPLIAMGAGNDAAGTSMVVVDMIPDATVLMANLTGAAAPTGMAAVLESPWMAPGSIILLAGISIALMLFMVRKATQAEALLSIEDLAGIPPTLPNEEDLIGEVEEPEASMEGVELDEAELKSRRIADQISEMIRANPQEAGGILGRWVATEE
jgi:flagellar biosynthesis/type III secretory pathway M-ring protein FliF/YscJ